MGLISGLLSLFGCGDRNANSQSQTAPTKADTVKTIPFDIQLATFKQLGFVLNAGIDTSDINRWGGHKKFENEPFSLMYVTLGQTIEREPWTPLTNKCWDFDTEAIEDNGSYISIMKNLERLAQGELKFENLKDHVDIENNKAWVSFIINGDEYKWDMKVEDDWVDTDLFSKVVALTNKYGTKGKFTYYDTGGQNAVIGFETTESIEKITKLTGLKIELLK